MKIKKRLTDIYDNNFYKMQAATSFESATEILPIVNAIFPDISSVADVGCGAGTWLKAWQDGGKKDIFCLGFDCNNLDDEFIYIPRQNIKIIDFTNGPLKTDVNKKFDIVQSLEVAEHLDENFGEDFVKTLTDLSDIVLFSAAAPRQGGTNHLNEQPPEYWAKIFKKYNYVCFDILRDKIWGNKKICWWYRQNILIFIKEDKAQCLYDQNYQSTISPNLYYHPEYLIRYWKHDDTYIPRKLRVFASVIYKKIITAKNYLGRF